MSRDRDDGDPAKGQFTRFFERHYDDVYRYAARRLGPDHADDVAAETFSVAWRRFDRLPKDHPLPWLYGVARNVVRARSRRGGLRAEVLSSFEEGAARVPAEPDTTRRVEERDEALRALGRLSGKDRELVMLLAWEGLELAEAARVLGCTTATARVRLFRARRRIEGFLDPSPPVRAQGPAPVRVPVEEA
ncbi:sigma-70 family RNA polymerase sigma factor [Nocardiopsis sp. CT-R113]|uniref:Sigma-70 family RNA polymerase sigma factor n=1 Tax=Nocardiopsis codii TaxID=3065942 RepID=A0ABU7KGK3_9ACTN|nr:sigma-70 family RNA polymerase sigma factor [Nocardiopsis sp. CT-R113]MEE2041327.1 sigma-70 family RNA polymerase sigma factor [Nocardiopsis sp. CT-R113]